MQHCLFLHSLYYGLHQPHVPRVPNERFAGQSGMGPRGDVILEADWCVSEFLKELDKLGLAENTIVVLTSDNGPVLDDGYKDDAVELVGDHKIAGPLAEERQVCSTEVHVYLLCFAGRQQLNHRFPMHSSARWICWHPLQPC